MATFAETPLCILVKSRPKEKKGSPSRDGGRKKPMLKELQEKKYPFSDLDLLRMLDGLLQSRIIKLPAPNRPEEAGRTNNPGHSWYHRIISYPPEQYITLKEHII